MQLHHLSITAFGPFTGTVEVDFDTLGRSGLFLLSGATGAGKTSVLDAVCFALYGDVPGDRSTAKRLRSDQAAPDVAPRVSLEATLAGRRFRLVRSPAWRRPKRRGTGTTPQQATVTCTELVDGSWVALSSRLDETGDLVGSLLGMSLTQFTQVAMLPQGQFQAFLHAAPDQRQELLQRLFRTGRFRQVEQWLRDRRVALGQGSRRRHDAVSRLVSRLSEAAADPLPDAWDLHDLAPLADDGSLARWAHQQHALAGASLGDARARTAPAVEVERAARVALEQARDELEGRRRRDEALRELDDLEAGGGAHSADVLRLERARAAQAVSPLVHAADEALARWSRCDGEAREQLGGVDELLHSADHRDDGDEQPDLDHLVDQALAASHRATAALRDEARRAQAADELERLLEQTAEAGRRRVELDARAELLPDVVAERREQVAVAQAAAGGLDALAQSSAELAERLGAHDEALRLAGERDAARTVWLDVRAHSLGLADELLALQQARVEGMAAELAGQLAVGCSCPVCGSAEHPSKAPAVPGAPDAAAERAARKRLDSNRAVEVAHDQQVRALEAQLAAAQGRAGPLTRSELAERLDAERRRLETMRRESAGLDGLLARLARAEAEQLRVSADLAELATLQARTETTVVALRAEIDTLDHTLAGVLAEGAHPSVQAAVDHHDRTVRGARTAQAAVRERDEAGTALGEAQRWVSAAAEEAGFACVDQARAATLAAAALDSLARVVDTHRARLVAVRRVLSELDSADPQLDLDPPDVAGLTRRHGEALDELTAVHSDTRLWTERRDRLAGLVAELEHELAAWAPERAELDLTTRLAAFVEGKSPDNQLQMRLSAYVLAYRLSQVVAAANERLSSMSARRYSLEHTDQRGARETRGGLSLLVRDDWSGEARDPATLSGGETFVVSLALALGLADVISHEAGGARLGTLFVDEGFGSLDADTLDDVMDTLDELRDGGRVVGVVSHVAEMRDRIPTQLVVTKARGGSTLAVRA